MEEKKITEIELKEQFATKLRVSMALRRVNISRLAAQSGLKGADISNWVNARNFPNAKSQAKLYSALNITAKEFWNIDL